MTVTWPAMSEAQMNVVWYTRAEVDGLLKALSSVNATDAELKEKIDWLKKRSDTADLALRETMATEEEVLAAVLVGRERYEALEARVTALEAK